jgi:hypothetical protein
MELEGTKIGVDMAKHKANLGHTHELEGTKIGVDIAKHKEQVKTQALQQAQQARQAQQSQQVPPKKGKPE